MMLFLFTNAVVIAFAAATNPTPSPSLVPTYAPTFTPTPVTIPIPVQVPIALHQLVVLNNADSVVIRLKSFAATNNKVIAIILLSFKADKSMNFCLHSYPIKSKRMA